MQNDIILRHQSYVVLVWQAVGKGITSLQGRVDGRVHRSRCGGHRWMECFRGKRRWRSGQRVTVERRARLALPHTLKQEPICGNRNSIADQGLQKLNVK